MRVRCPHCHNPVEIVDDSSFKDIVCSTCGSNFSLIGGADETETAAIRTRAIGHFQLTEQLGVGAFGTVWKAKDNQLDRIVAIKIPRKGKLSEAETEQFLREARAAAQLRHGNIVSVHEVGKDDDSVYIVSDYVEGADLKEWLGGNPLPPREAADLCAKIAEALHHAHEQGVVHRDLKPGNIMMDLDGTPHIMDFGLAKRESGEITMTVDGAILGTPAYMPPEQARGKGHEADRRADVYSLGVILFEALIGELPFRGEKRMLIVQILTEDAPNLRKLNSKVAKDLETICLSCLEKEPGRRYQTAQELADDLRRYLNGEPIHARPISSIGKAWRWCKRNPTYPSVLAASVLLVVAGFLIFKQIDHRRRGEALVQQLLTAETEDVPEIVEELAAYSVATPLLQAAFEQAEEDGDEKRTLHASLALVENDAGQVDYLFEQLLDAQVEDVSTIVTGLNPHKDRLRDRIWETIQTGSSRQRIRAAAAAAEYDRQNDMWLQVRDGVVIALVSAPVFESASWVEMLNPVGLRLVEPLATRYRSRSSERDAERPAVAAALAAFLKEDHEKLAELIVLADNDREFQPLLMSLRLHRQDAVAALQSLLQRAPAEDEERDERDSHWKRQSNAAVCLLELGQTETVWPLLKQTRNPSVRSFIIERLALLGANHETLSERLRHERDASVRYSLILALGEFDASGLSKQQRESLVRQLLVTYQEDPDSGVHSASSWTLRQWQMGEAVANIDAELRLGKSRTERNWYVNSQGQTFVVVNGPVEFMMGEKTEETVPELVTLSHRFAVAANEVTVNQFRAFRSDHEIHEPYAPEGDCPVNLVSWFDAAAYCNWLSKQESIPEDQWCYEPNDEGAYAEGMRIAPDSLERIGYRLPTEREWEYVCRANTTSTYNFGEPISLLGRYAWYGVSSSSRSWPVARLKPNKLGVFDIHGNVFEWCDAPEGDLSAANQNGLLVVRGGSFETPGFAARSGFRVRTGATPILQNRSNAGLRPARTMPDSD